MTAKRSEGTLKEKAVPKRALTAKNAVAKPRVVPTLPRQPGPEPPNLPQIILVASRFFQVPGSTAVG